MRQQGAVSSDLDPPSFKDPLFAIHWSCYQINLLLFGSHIL